MIHNLKLRRLARGWPRGVFARMIGYDMATVGRWERGEVLPTIAQLRDYADAVGCEIILQSK